MTCSSGIARRVLALAPPDADHWSALRVGLGVAVPALLLLALGREDLIVYVVFGAFTGMYGRSDGYRDRLVQQGRAAGMLVAAVTAGVLLSAIQASPWILVVVECAVAGGVSLYSDRVGLTPSGPFFALFALGSCAIVPLAIPWGAAVLLSAGSAVFSLGVGAAGWMKRRGRSRSPSSPARVGSSAATAVSYAIAIGVAGALSVVFSIGHPNWAMVSAAVPLSAVGVEHRVSRGIQRMLGTVLGLGVAAIILILVPTALGLASLGPVVLALVVIALQFPTELLMTRNYGLALVFFTPLIMVMTWLAHPVEPGGLLVDRAAETVEGALVGIGVAWLAHLRHRRGTISYVRIHDRTRVRAERLGSDTAGPPPSDR